MNQEETKAAYVAAQQIKVQADDYLNYQQKTKENTMALGILALSIGEKLTRCAGMECAPANGENLALKFVPKMDAQESAMVALLLDNLRAKILTNKPSNESSVLFVKNEFVKFEKIVNDGDAHEQELELYNLMGTIALAVLNWDSTAPKKEYNIELQEPIDINLLPYGFGDC